MEVAARAPARLSLSQQTEIPRGNTMAAPDPASRKPAYPIDPLFLQRWSPRAFQPGVEIPDEVLFTCLEAARWAPSSSNAQPWRFIYTKYGSDRWDVFLDSIK